MLNKRLNFTQSNKFWGEMQVFFALQLKHACRKLEDFLWIWAVLFSPSEHSFSFFYLIVRVNFCLLQFNQQTHYLLLEVVLLQRCISLIRTKWHSPHSPFPLKTHPRKKKEKKKGRKSIGRGLNTLSLL